MNRLINRNRLLALLFSVIVLIVLIGFSMNDRDSTTSAEQFTGEVTATSQSIINAPFQLVGNIFNTIRLSFSSISENERLRQQIEMTPQMEADNARLQEENEELREALDVSSKWSYETIPSRIISRAPDQWQDNFTIDKGSRDGVSEGMAVMTTEGLIGIVERANSNSSFVEIITTNNSQSRLSVEIETADETVYGNVLEYDPVENHLIIENIQNRSNVEVGDAVYSSGLAGNLPEGLIIGEVDRVQSDEYGLSERAYVTLAADFHHVDLVFVLKRDPSSTGEE
ncbi:rod shape-determining protein MreC [Aliicoccus persicus]|uniref:Cell shape-determining protein MreC n=1 Tax=Aliicoccus persicus TaxID=930138 RepID=A0A662Z1D1_9STAP|nr:rod shape-determining protein MreC [Aliicoccus persicus]SEV85992.1 rod shape-determining protein MreC [Aliicoccus persicus]